MFSLPLIFLDSPEIFFIRDSIYCDSRSGNGLEMSLSYAEHLAHARKQSHIAILTILHLKIFINQVGCFV